MFYLQDVFSDGSRKVGEGVFQVPIVFCLNSLFIFKKWCVYFSKNISQSGGSK